MAKSRRKAGGCTHGRFKAKKLGKGWSAHNELPPRALKRPKKEGEPAKKA